MRIPLLATAHQTLLWKGIEFKIDWNARSKLFLLSLPKFAHNIPLVAGRNLLSPYNFKTLTHLYFLPEEPVTVQNLSEVTLWEGSLE